MKKKLISTTILFSLLFIVSGVSITTDKCAVKTCGLLEKTRCVSILTNG